VSRELLVAGGGIGGLAAALAARHAGWEARVLEQSPAFSEVGAGIQLGPNVVRILREWELLGAGELQQLVFAPQRLRVRDGVDGGELAVLPLAGMEQRYGAPYLTVHRADLHAVLLAAARARGVRLHTARKVQSLSQQDGAVRVAAGGPDLEAEAVVLADALSSEARRLVAGDGAPHSTGHLAYRGLVRQADLPPPLRSREVTVWLAPRMHLVTYPVRGGDVLNTVCLVEGRVQGDPRNWDHLAVRSELEAALGPVAAGVRDQLAAVPEWRLWALHDRAPVASAEALARGRVALLGDAAHPMLPYLAQGAGMAIEDARELERVLAVADERIVDVTTAFRRYALNRWQRVARVQARSRRNARIFHADGPLRFSRNLALRTLGARLLDQPWLYAA